MKKLIVLSLCAILFSCTSQTHTEPPPGWTIVCDIQRGYYAPQRIETGFVIQHGYDDKPMKSKQDAIDRAWGYYEFLRRTLPIEST